MLAVATESLAALMVVLAGTEHARWLLVAAIVPFVLGLCFYAFVIAWVWIALAVWEVVLVGTIRPRPWR